MTTAPAPLSTAPRRTMARLPAILILTAIGLGQVMVALVFLRSVPDNLAQGVTTDAAATAPAAEPKKEAADHGHDEHDTESEVDLGTFSMTVSTDRARPLMVSFHLYGTLNESKHSEFSARYEAQHHRLRQEVIVLLRGSDINVLSDPDLTELKKLLLARLNRLLGKASLNDVIFSDFAIMQH